MNVETTADKEVLDMLLRASMEPRSHERGNSTYRKFNEQRGWRAENERLRRRAPSLV